MKANHVYKIADQPWLDYSALGNKLAMDEAKNCSKNKHEPVLQKVQDRLFYITVYLYKHLLI